MILEHSFRQVELSFQTGDIIYVYGDMDDDGFYLGELRGQRGLVPSNFLTEAPPDYDPSQPRQHKRAGPTNSDKGAPMDRTRDSSYYSRYFSAKCLSSLSHSLDYWCRSRDRMDHERDRDRGMSGAEGPPPPPRTGNHRQSSESRERRCGEFIQRQPL